MDDRTASPELRALVLTEDAGDPAWCQRGIPDGAARSGLLGWVMSAAAIDALVPGPVTEMLSRSLTRCARVTYLLSEALTHARSPHWSDVALGQSIRLRPAGWLRLFGRKPTFPLLCTESPTVAARLFASDDFDWSQRGQLALLSPRDAPPPRLSHALFDALWNDSAPPSGATLSEAGLTGFVSPAVDGDFAQIVAFSDPLWEALLDALAGECAAAGIALSRVDEAAFRKTRWLLDEKVADAP